MLKLFNGIGPALSIREGPSWYTVVNPISLSLLYFWNTQDTVLSSVPVSIVAVPEYTLNLYVPVFDNSNICAPEPLFDVSTVTAGVVPRLVKFWW